MVIYFICDTIYSCSQRPLKAPLRSQLHISESWIERKVRNVADFLLLNCK